MSATSLKRALMADVYDGAALETLLAVDGSLADYTELINSYSESIYLAGSVHALDAIFNSSTAWEMWVDSWIARMALASSDFGTRYVCENGAALVPLLASNLLLDPWLSYPENLARIQSRVNASGSKLKRQVFTGSGTWTKPGTLLAQSAYLLGGGAGGNYQYGGGGGEMKTENYSVLSTGNETVTIGNGGGGTTSGSSSDGTATSIGSLSATYGRGSGNSGLGGGSTTGNGYKDMTNWADPRNAFWQAATVSQQGNSGGSAVFTNLRVANLGIERIPGVQGYPGYGQAANEATVGSAGRFPGGAGGGGGYAGTAGTANSRPNVTADSNSGAGGGAGAIVGGSYTSGQSGGTGLAVKHWVEG